MTLFIPFQQLAQMGVNSLIELDDIDNIKELPVEPKAGELRVLCFDRIKDGKMKFVFRNIGNRDVKDFISELD